MWESTRVKVYCLTCGKKVNNDAMDDSFSNISIEDHLKDNPDHICIKGKTYKKCEDDDELKLFE